MELGSKFVLVRHTGFESRLILFPSLYERDI